MPARPGTLSSKAEAEETTGEIDAALLSVARAMTQVRVHGMLRKRADVELDRGGAAVLYKLWTEGEGIRLCDLAERLGIDSPAVTRKVQQLEALGLLARATDPDDGRASRLALTRSGRSSIERLLRARRDWIETLLSTWNEQDKERFAALLHRFASTVDQDLQARHVR